MSTVIIVTKDNSTERNEESKNVNKEIKKTETMMIYTEVEKAFGKDEDQNYQHSALTILGELIS